MTYQWYPGHMTKAYRNMVENVKLVDLLIELVDARIPVSSRNPDIDEIGKNKNRIVILNKSDLADSSVNEKWVSYFEKSGINVLKVNSKDRGTLNSLNNLVRTACREKIERDRKRGILNRPIRAMVVGIPNVGKSTFINSLSGRASAKTGNKPGVTKGLQWIKLNQSLELLDTPGILWPKFESEIVGLHLALVGSINDEILHTDELACSLLDILVKDYPQNLLERFGQDLDIDGNNSFELLKGLAVRRNYLRTGSEPDVDKMASVLLDEYRGGVLGKISLESPGV